MDDYNFYRYIDDKSILVITPKNKLIRIRCPFAVSNAYNEIFQVDEVININGVLNYKIRGKYNLYCFYTILNNCKK